MDKRMIAMRTQFNDLLVMYNISAEDLDKVSILPKPVYASGIHLLKQLQNTGPVIALADSYEKYLELSDFEQIFLGAMYAAAAGKIVFDLFMLNVRLEIETN